MKRRTFLHTTALATLDFAVTGDGTLAGVTPPDQNGVVTLAVGEVDPADAALWRDWYRFTLDLAVAGAFSTDATEQKMARIFVATSLAAVGKPVDVFASPATCRAALEALPPSAEHMIFFEYNFLYVLAAGGRPDKSALGDHTPAGYRQRARFYAISAEGRPTVKLSDNPAKAMGPADQIARYKRVFGLGDQTAQEVIV